jgi:hypothetical protein
MTARIAIRGAMQMPNRRQREGAPPHKVGKRPSPTRNPSRAGGRVGAKNQNRDAGLVEVAGVARDDRQAVVKRCRGDDQIR